MLPKDSEFNKDSAIVAIVLSNLFLIIVTVLVVARRNYQPLKARSPTILCILIANAFFMVNFALIRIIIGRDHVPCFVYIGHYVIFLPMYFVPLILHTWRLYYIFRGTRAKKRLYESRMRRFYNLQKKIASSGTVLGGKVGFAQLPSSVIPAGTSSDLFQGGGSNAGAGAGVVGEGGGEAGISGFTGSIHAAAHHEVPSFSFSNATAAAGNNSNNNNNNNDIADDNQAYIRFRSDFFARLVGVTNTTTTTTHFNNERDNVSSAATAAVAANNNAIGISLESNTNIITEYENNSNNNNSSSCSNNHNNNNRNSSASCSSSNNMTDNDDSNFHTNHDDDHQLTTTTETASSANNNNNNHGMMMMDTRQKRKRIGFPIRAPASFHDRIASLKTRSVNLKGHIHRVLRSTSAAATSWHSGITEPLLARFYKDNGNDDDDDDEDDDNHYEDHHMLLFDRAELLDDDDDDNNNNNNNGEQQHQHQHPPQSTSSESEPSTNQQQQQQQQQQQPEDGKENKPGLVRELSITDDNYFRVTGYTKADEKEKLRREKLHELRVRRYLIYVSDPFLMLLFLGFLLTQCLIFVIILLAMPELRDTEGCHVYQPVMIIMAVECTMLLAFVLFGAFLIRNIKDRFNISKEIVFTLILWTVAIVVFVVCMFSTSYVNNVEYRYFPMAYILIVVVMIYLAVLLLVPGIMTFVWKRRQAQALKNSMICRYSGIPNEPQEDFFGGSLKDVLEDNTYGLKEAFRQHCDSEFSPESLMCWEDIQFFKSLACPQKQSAMAVLINDTYVSDKAPLPLNISPALRDEIAEVIRQGTGAIHQGMFDSLQQALETVMLDSFSRFSDTKQYKAMIENANLQLGLLKKSVVY